MMTKVGEFSPVTMSKPKLQHQLYKSNLEWLKQHQLYKSDLVIEILISTLYSNQPELGSPNLGNFYFIELS